jgi:DNA-binding MarR family transcriptional regulator
LYRQNTILNDFVNFLKARGRFRDIEFIENSVHATPRIPDMPNLVFYIEDTRSEQHYTLEIHGDESPVMNKEIQDFFNLNQLDLIRIKVRYTLSTLEEDILIIEAEGIGNPFDELIENVNTLLTAKHYSITGTQKTLIFSKIAREPIKPPKRPLQITRPQIKRQAVSPKFSLKKTQPTISTSSVKQIKVPKKPVITSQRKPQLTKETTNYNFEKTIDQIKSVSSISSKAKENVIAKTKIEAVEVMESKQEEIDFAKREEEFFGQKFDEPKPSIEETESDLFHPKPPSRMYSNDVAPYLKQTSSLFRRDNWEEDLPTEFEMEILERTYMRIKHRTKPEILAKDMQIPLDDAENHLRSLISKGLLRTQVGWYIIKKSHLPFFKRTFAEGEKKKKKKKSPRISRVGEGLTPEEISTIKAIKSRPNLKAQSNLLTRPTGLKQSVLKEVLRNLVDKGILRVSYGWYILKDKYILEQKRGSAQAQPQESKKFQIPKELDLTSAEERVIQALLTRPQFKAQSNLLTSDVKMPKDQIKQVLRDLVEKDICKVTYGWYMLKNPDKFQLHKVD